MYSVNLNTHNKNVIQIPEKVYFTVFFPLSQCESLLLPFLLKKVSTQFNEVKITIILPRMRPRESTSVSIIAPHIQCKFGIIGRITA